MHKLNTTLQIKLIILSPILVFLVGFLAIQPGYGYEHIPASVVLVDMKAYVLESFVEYEGNHGCILLAVTPKWSFGWPLSFFSYHDLNKQGVECDYIEFSDMRLLGNSLLIFLILNALVYLKNPESLFD